MKFLIVDLSCIECKGCCDLREEIKKMNKRLERVERIVPAVKQFYYSKKVSSYFVI